MWDQRYQTKEYVYGKNPNDFLASVIDELPKGRVLSLAEGEGRNAVFMAIKGFDVLAVDLSEVGLAKATQLAHEAGVHIQTQVADLSQYDIAPHTYDVIVSIFCHLPSDVRKKVHQNIVRSLKPGGFFIMESFSKEQLQYNTGGPKSLDMLMELDEVLKELEGLHFKIARKTERDVLEGNLHSGKSAVNQILAIKP